MRAAPEGGVALHVESLGEVDEMERGGKEEGRRKGGARPAVITKHGGLMSMSVDYADHADFAELGTRDEAPNGGARGTDAGN